MSVRNNLLLSRIDIVLLAAVACLASALAWLGSDAHSNQYIPSSVDLVTATAEDLSSYLQDRVFTSVQLVNEYLRRIELDNVRGRTLHAILRTTPKHVRLQIAQNRDEERAANATRGPLHGLPVVVKVSSSWYCGLSKANSGLKDNMWTGPELGMPTTFGAYAFENATALEDATLVARAQQAGLIVIGKANLAVRFALYQGKDVRR